MSAFDVLRPPVSSDPTARAYKDWLHLNVFDARTGLIALINTSLHGPPDDRRSRAVGVALAWTMNDDWNGGIEIAGFRDVSIGSQAIMLETISIAVTPDQRSIRAAVRRRADGLEADLIATPAARPFGLETRSPFGSGWISWHAVPLLRITGEIRIDGRRIDLSEAIAYHDQNRGRWYWGEDIAWEWGAFAFPTLDAVFVFARACDKKHERLGPTHFFMERNGQTTVFAVDRLSVEYAGALGPVARRIPGALAAVHPDRHDPGLPATIVITAVDGMNTVRLALNARTAAQVILAEPTRPGYSFINEIAGTCAVSGRVGDMEFTASGLGIFEYAE